MQSVKATTTALVAALFIGIFIGVYSADRNSPTPTPVPIPDPIPDTPTPDKPICVVVGEQVGLTETEGGTVAWVVEPPVPDLVTYGDRNESLVVSFRTQGHYTVIAAIVQSAYGKSDGVVLKRYAVVVGDPAPNPGPGPNPRPVPEPEPGPVPTPAPTDFAELIKLVPDKAGAVKLAAAFRETAKLIQDSIDARKLMPPDEIVELTQTQNDEALGAAIPKWKTFFAGLETVLNRLAKEGKLLTMQDHVDRWRELATTLESVK